MPAREVTSNNRWSSRNYGSRRGLINTVWHQLLDVLGYYRSYRDIDWSQVNRLVFVCKGNICRSAYAEAVARRLDIDAISFGLDTIDGAPANAYAIGAAEKLDVDLNEHRTTTDTSVDLQTGDLLIAMEPWQIEALKKTHDDRFQYSLLGLWSSPALPHIEDPYGSTCAYFEKCFLSIQQAVDRISEKMLR